MAAPEERRRLTSKNPDEEVLVFKPGPKEGPLPRSASANVKKGDNPVHLVVEQPGTSGQGGLKKSLSMTSMNIHHMRDVWREKRQRLRNNQCAGIVLFLLLGTSLNVLSYFASVWSAQLNKEVIDAAVANEHALKFKMKKALIEAPSKYLIGLLNFGGRILSAVGTVMLVQVIAAYTKRRRYGIIMKSAAGEADEIVTEVHGGITDAAGECCLSCVQSLT